MKNQSLKQAYKALALSNTTLASQVSFQQAELIFLRARLKASDAQMAKLKNDNP